MHVCGPAQKPSELFDNALPKHLFSGEQGESVRTVTLETGAEHRMDDTVATLARVTVVQDVLHQRQVLRFHFIGNHALSTGVG